MSEECCILKVAVHFLQGKHNLRLLHDGKLRQKSSQSVALILETALFS